MEEIKGQYSIFGGDPKAKGAHYDFDRYIGQKVRDSHGEHVIKEIEKYYTIFEDGMVGTPHDLAPVEHHEKMECLYNKYKSELDRMRDETDESKLRMHYLNLRNITKALKEEDERGENDEKR